MQPAKAGCPCGSRSEAPLHSNHGAQMAIISYSPELGEKKPEKVQGRTTLSHNGKHYFLDTPLELKGRGITFDRTYKATDLTEAGQYKVGWHQYQVTHRAMKALAEQYDFSRENLLD